MFATIRNWLRPKKEWPPEPDPQAPSDTTCLCGNGVEEGSILRYRDNFFCSWECCDKAIAERQKLVAQFFSAVNREMHKR